MKFLVAVFLLSVLWFSAHTKPSKSNIDSNTSELSNPLQTALYSAVLPGLGQAHNKQYWKIPIVWGAVGTGVGFVFYYNKRYREFRDGFLASLNDDPTGFPDAYTTEILASAQDDQRRNRDFAIVITTLLYTMNILDALVSAHLMDIKKDKDLAIAPVLIPHPIHAYNTPGLGFRLQF